MTQPTVVRVEIEHNFEGGGITVWPVWSGVDRERGSGYGLNNTPAHRELALRLRTAMLAGAVYEPAIIATDVNGKTFARASSKVLGRTMNADLARLGY